MKTNVDLLLVNPGNRKQTYGDMAVSFAGIEPPIWCALTAAFIMGKGYSVEIIDADAEGYSPEQVADKIIECGPVLTDIVVLGTNPSASSTPKMTAVSDTLKQLKRKNQTIKTVLSGLHPSALPERTLGEECTDFICQGEGFYTILNLLKVLKSGENTRLEGIEGLWYKKDGKIISNSPAQVFKNLDELPFAAWDLLPMDKYRAHNWHCLENLDERSHYTVIYTSLGCPFNCSYCPIHAFYCKQGIRYRDIGKVVEEIDFLVKKYGVKNIKIMDELFVLKRDRVIQFCDMIIGLGHKLNFWVYARIDTVDENVLKKMKQAGINWISYGFESANEIVRMGVDKRISQDRIKETVEITGEAGIYIMANFIFGLPDDNMETMQETLDMAKKFNFEYVNFYVTMAYPGSQLYIEAISKGIPMPKEWDEYSQLGYETLPLPTKYLKPYEVLRFRDKAFEEYFSNPRYLAMIEEKFGIKAVEHIKEMLSNKIQRKNVNIG